MTLDAPDPTRSDASIGDVPLGAHWPGEQLSVHDGVEVLTWVSVPEQPVAPTIVLLPGVGHLGRIFYGHPGSAPEHFLAHRLVASGHPVVAVSYPLDNPVFPMSRPDLTMAAWATALAGATRAAVAEHGLADEVVVTAWSGAGGVATRVGPALRAVGLDPLLLVALVASPPMLGLSPAWDEYPLRHATAGGFVGLDGLLAWFEHAVEAVDDRAGAVVLPADRFRRDYLGAFPVAMCVSTARYRPSGLVPDAAEAAADLAAADIAAMPLVAVIHDTDPDDAGHALRDRWSWAPYIAAWLHDHLAADVGSADRAAWQATRALFDELGDRLVRSVEGNHFCFVGAGAAETATAIDELIAEAADLRAQVEIA